LDQVLYHRSQLQLSPEKWQEAVTQITQETVAEPVITVETDKTENVAVTTEERFSSVSNANESCAPLTAISNSFSFPGSVRSTSVIPTVTQITQETVAEPVITVETDKTENVAVTTEESTVDTTEATVTQVPDSGEKVPVQNAQENKTEDTFI